MGPRQACYSDAPRPTSSGALLVNAVDVAKALLTFALVSVADGVGESLGGRSFDQVANVQPSSRTSEQLGRGKWYLNSCGNHNEFRGIDLLSSERMPIAWRHVEREGFRMTLRRILRAPSNGTRGCGLRVSVAEICDRRV